MKAKIISLGGTAAILMETYIKKYVDTAIGPENDEKHRESGG